MLACKMADLMIEALKRDATWLVIVQTDHYLLSSWYDEAARMSWGDPARVVVRANCCCGIGKFPQCPGVHAQGNPCGGVPYAFSRGALEMLVGERTPDNEARIRSTMLNISEREMPEDVGLGCLARTRGVPIEGISTRNHPVCPSAGREHEWAVTMPNSATFWHFPNVKGIKGKLSVKGKTSLLLQHHQGIRDKYDAFLRETRS
jgi:hypothetical protein